MNYFQHIVRCIVSGVLLIFLGSGLITRASSSRPASIQTVDDVVTHLKLDQKNTGESFKSTFEKWINGSDVSVIGDDAYRSNFFEKLNSHIPVNSGIEIKNVKLPGLYSNNENALLLSGTTNNQRILVRDESCGVIRRCIHRYFGSYYVISYDGSDTWKPWVPTKLSVVIENNVTRKSESVYGYFQDYTKQPRDTAVCWWTTFVNACLTGVWLGLCVKGPALIRSYLSQANNRCVNIISYASYLLPTYLATKKSNWNSCVPQYNAFNEQSFVCHDNK